MDGWYDFITGVEGNHLIVESDPAQHFSTTPNEVQISVSLGNSYRVDYGDFALCTCLPDDFENDDSQAQAMRSRSGCLVYRNTPFAMTLRTGSLLPQLLEESTLSPPTRMVNVQIPSLRSTIRMDKHCWQRMMTIAVAAISHHRSCMRSQRQEFTM